MCLINTIRPDLLIVLNLSSLFILNQNKSKDLRNFFDNIFFPPDLESYTYFSLLLSLWGPSKFLDPSSLRLDRISVWVHEGDTSGTSIEKKSLFQKCLLRPRKCPFSFSWYFLMLKTDGQDLHLSTLARTYTNSYFSKTVKVKYNISSLQCGKQKFHVKIISQVPQRNFWKRTSGLSFILFKGLEMESKFGRRM